jgi:hypothetical protein
MISKEEIHENDVEDDKAFIQRYRENEYERFSGKVVRTVWMQ